MSAERCPTCQKRFEYEKPEEAPYRPFCGRRCQLIDLRRWLSEDFRISEPAESNPEGAASPDEPREP